MAKKRVSASEPKYERENGSRSGDAMCFRSIISISMADATFYTVRVDARFHGPWRMAKPSMNNRLPSVNANANFLGFTATAS